MSIQHLITPAMVRAIDQQRRNRPDGKGAVEMADHAVWSNITAIEQRMRMGRHGVLPADAVLDNGFTHEVRALILTAVARLVRHQKAQANSGYPYLSPIQRLSSMYAGLRKAAPDVPVAEILQRTTGLLHA